MPRRSGSNGRPPDIGGLVPPLELERDILAAAVDTAIALEADSSNEAACAALEAIEALEPDAFWHPAHRRIFQTQLDVIHRADTVTWPLVVAELRNRSAEQEVFEVVAALATNPASFRAVPQGVRELRRAAHKRRLFANLTQIQACIVEDDLEAAEQALGTLAVVATPTGLRLDDHSPDRLFRTWTAAELVGAPRTFEWLCRGLVVRPTYGMQAGQKKSLKTYMNIALALGVAAGLPVFGHFQVDKPAPVVLYVGEGGRIPYTRRLERVADAMGVALQELPLHISFDTAPIGSPRFAGSLERDLEVHEPGLVSIDPYYAFHGSSRQADSRNLFDEGAHLTSLSEPVVDAGASLVIVNHFNQTGVGRDLDRITQAGGAEWSDSWWLVSHRNAPDVPHGLFTLLLEVGSRQWGGTAWDLDVSMGVFDPELEDYRGHIEWTIARHVEEAASEEHSTEILELLDDEPWALTKNQVCTRHAGDTKARRSAFDVLVRAARIRSLRLQKREGSTLRSRDLWALAEEPEPATLPTLEPELPELKR